MLAIESTDEKTGGGPLTGSASRTNAALVEVGDNYIVLRDDAGVSERQSPGEECALVRVNPKDR